MCGRARHPSPPPSRCGARRPSCLHNQIEQLIILFLPDLKLKASPRLCESVRSGCGVDEEIFTVNEIACLSGFPVPAAVVLNYALQTRGAPSSELVAFERQTWVSWLGFRAGCRPLFHLPLRIDDRARREAPCEAESASEEAVIINIWAAMRRASIVKIGWAAVALKRGKR